MVPIGRVRRLGVFVLDQEGALSATGAITRALPPGRPAYQSLSAESRREYRDAAFRGPFIAGETVNYDSSMITLQTDELRASPGPLILRSGKSMVRWNSTAGEASDVGFEAYIVDATTANFTTSASDEPTPEPMS